ncbi:MAG: hypothetical protein AB8B93_05960 [Pseudomonadales bacterium]
MSIETSVAKILRTSPIQRINFKIEMVAVTPALLANVAKAIDDGRIAVVEGGSGPSFSASYTQLRTSRAASGNSGLIGRLTVGKQAPSTNLGKAAIVHESVHALVDLVPYKKLTMHKDEAIAYLADAIYMRALQVKLTNTGKVKALYDAAYALVDQKQLLTKPGTALKWDECQSLLAAIKAIPAYR